MPTAPLRTQWRSDPLPALERHLLWGWVLGRDRAWLWAHDDYCPTNSEQLRYQSAQQRRLSGEPIAYIVGQREFMGLPLTVSPAVLIPRPDTEVLVEAALAHYRPGLRALDLGTGSGAIALAIAHHAPGVQVVAVDKSPEALAVATQNAQVLGLSVSFYQGDWFDALPADTPAFDLVLSNPPYIHPDDPHLQQGDLRFEPLQALSDGEDGLSAYRHIVQRAPAYLQQGGWLMCEHGYDQGDAVAQLLRNRHFQHVQTLCDLSGHPRVAVGQWFGSGEG